MLMNLRINRNIVECKGNRTGAKKTGTQSINRNIVECKVARQIDKDAGTTLVLIET